MRRLWTITALVCLFSGMFLGCTQRNKNKEEDDPAKAVTPVVQVQPPDVKPPNVKQKGNENKKGTDNGDPENKEGQDGQQEKYEAALSAALTALAERDWSAALGAFETARSFQNTDFVQSEIARLKQRIDQEGSVKNTVKNIETVLNEGKADEAAKLAAQGLQEFGDGDDASRLVQLRLQAEAMQGVQKKEDPDARHERFRKEGDAALAEKNLRAAALAYEQALQSGENEELQKSYEEIRGKLDQYDALRQKAAELRRNAAQIDEVVDTLKQAKEAWDTLQIRQELDEAMLALQNRRDTVSVTDFEVRNEVGMPNAGPVLADELLPLLKRKFDLVEREQIKRVIAELKLEKGLVTDAAQQKQVGELAKVRYLVVGSIHRLAAVSVHARLIDVRSGLVVQTAKVLAPTMEEAINLAPELAKQLMMTDQEKMQMEQQGQENVAMRPNVVPENAMVPPAPLPPAKNDPPPPQLINANLAPPAPAAMKVNIFAKFAPPPQEGAAPVMASAPPESKTRQRMLLASLEMGDFLFRASRFAEAQRQYEFALSLDPDNFDIRMRVERSRPLVPPPVMFIGQPAPVIVKPRLAVLTFGVGVNPLITPPSLSTWTPNNLAPYFSTRYDVVDPGEIGWFMARSGLSMRDLVDNPYALRWLSRAVGVRYFVFGNHLETIQGTFDVHTHLVDAEFGYQRGTGRITVQNTLELKLRLPELAELTMMSPQERATILERQEPFERLVRAGLRHMDRREYDLAIPDFENALRLRPGSVQAQYYLNQSRQLAWVFGIEIERRRNREAQEAANAAAQKRQWEVVREAELARQQAITLAAARSNEQREANLRLRIQTQSALLTQARLALKTRRFGLSVNFFQGALESAPPANVQVADPVPLPPQQEIFQNFAQARLEAEKAERLRAAELVAVREGTLRQVREQQLRDARKQIALEQERTQEALEIARQAQMARDERAYAAGLKQGQALLAQSKFDAALAALQTAQQLKQTEALTQLIELTVRRQAEALAKNDTERQELERKFLVERERRRAGEAQARHNEELYKLALQNAHSALAQKQFDIAQTKFQEAAQLYRTDEVLAGLKQVESHRAAVAAEAEKPVLEQKKADTVKQLIASGNTALEAKEYTTALQAFQEARKLAPDNLDVTTGLMQAQQAKNRLQAEARLQAEERNRLQSFQRLFKSGKDNLAGKNLEAAVANLTEAVKLNPTDPPALAALKEATLARDARLTSAKAQADARKRSEDYQRLLTDGRLALNSRRYAEAIKSFSEAQKLLPGDKDSKDYLQEAQSAKKAAEDAIAAAAKKQANDLKKATEMSRALTQGRTALAANDLARAAKLLDQAKQLAPENPDVQNALRELDQTQKQAAVNTAKEKKRQQDFQTQLTAGKEALSARHYPDALKALSSATTLIPNHPEAQELFRRAQKEAQQAEETANRAKLQELITTGLSALKAKNYDAAEKSLRSASLVDPANPAIAQGLKELEQGRKALLAEQRRQSEYQLALSLGQKALLAQHYDEAAKQFQQALKIMPSDAKATQGLLQAQQAQNSETKTQASFKLALDTGQAALTAKKYAEAVNAFKTALQLNPNDARTQQLLQQAQQALQGAEATNLVQANYQKAMTAGQKALTAKQYPAAIQAFTEALKLVPDDQKATLHLQQAQQGQADAKLLASEMALKQAKYQEMMKAGQTAMFSKKYEDAIKAYGDALKLMPKDFQAQRGWQDAQKALDASKLKTSPITNPDPPKTFDQAMQKATALEKEQKYSEAAMAFQEALKLRPKDATAQAGFNKNQLNAHVVQGQQYLDSMMFIEATREFESALRYAPNNPNLLKLLQKAKNKMK